MEIMITVDGDPEGVRPFYEESLAVPELAEATLRSTPAPPGALSSHIADAIAFLVHDSSGASALAAVIISWIRSQRGKVKITISGPRGKFEIHGTQVRNLSTDGLKELITETTHALEPDPSGMVKHQPVPEEMNQSQGISERSSRPA